MSFRELRSFTEVMKALGYPRMISMENFRSPNFELVTDCLVWLVHRFYPGVEISDEISTESDRVKFLQSVAQVMLTKARMKLNIKKLYSADGLAVKELLKVASLLYKATTQAIVDDEDGNDAVDFSSTLKGFNPKEVKQCASEILKSGALLFDGLGLETQLKEYRSRAVAGHLDTDFVERSVQEAISQCEDQIRVLEQEIEGLEKQEKKIDGNIEKRKQELERKERHLANLQNVRPPYMAEYERLEGELNKLYTQYLDRFRSLEYLENELELYYQQEQEKVEAADKRLQRMRKKLRDEELRILRGEQEVNEDAMGEVEDSEEEGEEGDEGDDDDLSDMDDEQKFVPKQSHNTTLKRGEVLKTAPNAKKQPPGGRQVTGALGHYDDDEASIDEDENSDGGEVSAAGSGVGGGEGMHPMGPGMGNGIGIGMMNGEEDEELIQDDEEEEENDF